MPALDVIENTCVRPSTPVVKVGVVIVGSLYQTNVLSSSVRLTVSCRRRCMRHRRDSSRSSSSADRTVTAMPAGQWFHSAHPGWSLAARSPSFIGPQTDIDSCSVCWTSLRRLATVKTRCNGLDAAQSASSPALFIQDTDARAHALLSRTKQPKSLAHLHVELAEQPLVAHSLHKLYKKHNCLLRA